MALFAPDGGVVLSPSDLTAAARCELGWLRRIDAQRGRADRIDKADPLLERIARLGDAHEARELERLRAERTVVEIERPTPYTAEGLQRAADRTHQALLDGADVVAQAVLYDGVFGGMADFLVRDDDGRYEVWDAKLARHVRVPALLQIAAYADQLDRLSVPRAPEGYLLLGDRTRAAQRLDEIIPVFRRRRAYLSALLAEHLAQPTPATWGDDRFAICGDCPVCEDGIATSDDVLQVAGLSRAQRTTLRHGGVTTMTGLAESTGAVDGMTERTWHTLREQAALQTGAAGVAFEVFDASHLHLLPEPDSGDIFFDFEGDPMWTDSDGVASGLEYLFGLVELEPSGHDGPQSRFTAFWAHDRAAEKQALIDFFEHVARRRAQYPGLHIYHYAPYEPTALKRLTVRHGYGEDQLDDLLRDGVFVDLYAAVRRSIRVSAPSYSIKKLEPLYMGDQLRDADGVTTAGDSILQYHEFMEARADGDLPRAEKLLGEIGDYNEYDCVSTWRLRDWLLGHRTGEAPLLGTGEGKEREPGKLAELQAVADELLSVVPADRAERDSEQQGIALLAAALGYFRREDKPMWWAYFDRAISPVDEWLDVRDTVVAESVQVIEGWAKATRRAQTFTRTLRLAGDIDPGTTLGPGSELCAVYEDVPACITVDPGAHRGFTRKVKVLSIGIDEHGAGVIELEEKTTKEQDGFAQLPMAVFKFTFINTTVLEKAVQELAGDTVHAAQLPAQAASDILARRAPRLTTGTFDASTAGDAVSAETLVATVRALDDSYLAVQGPPGAGKTYLGSHVVADLVRSGWKVGVVAQGHATVEHFLDQVVDVGVSPDLVGKKPKDPGDDHHWKTLKDKGDIATFVDGEGGRVLGGTAWTFAALPPETLDLLVIDEAGQFSLAHTIAAARPARRLLLLGDPQQLPQVSQGSHPEPVDQSALGWLADGHDTLPTDRGYFLAKTWRMHSALTTPVSDLAYDGRLLSQVDVTDTRALDEISPGLHSMPVRHTGNSVVSAEESEKVVALVNDLIGATWHPGEDKPGRALAPDDIIVVAAYNAQVAAIRRALNAAGFDGTKVGTVDKIQGQEAPVTIVSLAASSAADIPRGLEFLLDRRRLNVAISRAQWASFLVHSPGLGDDLPTSVEGLIQLGSFLRLLEA